MPSQEEGKLLNKIATLILLPTFLLSSLTIWKASKYKIGVQRNEPNARRDHFQYILIWTKPNEKPMSFFEAGETSFRKNNCTNTNCYITGKREYLASYTEFDAIIFNGKVISNLNFNNDLPKERLPSQKYVFAALESAHYYPITNAIFDNYFNWTWTYRIDSDYRWNYITIYDLNGYIVGPAADIKWPELMPITDEVKKKIRRKTKAVAWMVSNCNSKSNRLAVVQAINAELLHYNYRLDVYGKCAFENFCPMNTSKPCYNALQNYYYFYLSFENSFHEDYVTEKLITALDNFVVPIVYGGANYCRFLPPGSYLTATDTNTKLLVKQMVYLMNNRTAYEDFFRWRNHFEYKSTCHNKDLCAICDTLHDQQKRNEVSVKRNFIRWWNANSRASIATSSMICWYCVVVCLVINI